jgi:signal-transduction protein with cAMP-binding, CBS, and nucleotidyltransferase domain
MDVTQKKVLQAIQHITNTARLKAYKFEDHKAIASLLDDADHLFNLLLNDKIDMHRIKRILNEIQEQYPECSKTSLTLE